MDVWLPGVLSLFGALVGVGLANYLSNRTMRRDEAERRLNDAIRAVAVARAAAQFSYRAGVAGVPDAVQDSDQDDLARRLWLSAVERYFVRLREAREAVATLTIDGIDLTHHCQSDERMQADLDVVWSKLHRQAGRIIDTPA